MIAGLFCNREVIICSASESVLEAARRMRDRHVGCLVVVEGRAGGRTPVGVLTDRDVLVGPVAAGLHDLDRIRVAEVMTQPAITARDGEDLVDVLQRMRAHGVRRIPVVDEDDVLQGIIAFDDALELLAGEMGDLAMLIFRERRREAGHVPEPA
jgi:CBS domain-containing protein